MTVYTHPLTSITNHPSSLPSPHLSQLLAASDSSILSTGTSPDRYQNQYPSSIAYAVRVEYVHGCTFVLSDEVKGESSGAKKRDNHHNHCNHHQEEDSSVLVEAWWPLAPSPSLIPTTSSTSTSTPSVSTNNHHEHYELPVGKVLMLEGDIFTFHTAEVGHSHWSTSNSLTFPTLSF